MSETTTITFEKFDDAEKHYNQLNGLQDPSLTAYPPSESFIEENGERKKCWVVRVKKWNLD